MTDLVLFWHRRDLRLTDNLGLAEARQRSAKLIPLFCFDPHILERDDIAPARMAYLLGCLESLEHRYRQVGGRLLFLQGKPEEKIPQLADLLGARAVYWNQDVEPYSRERDRRVKERLTQQGVEVHERWDQLLHAPGEVLTGTSNNCKPYTVYTPYWKNWSRQPKEKPVPSPEPLEMLSERDEQKLETVGAIALPSLKDLGFAWDAPLILEPGEAVAKAQLESFCLRGIYSYDEQRNYPFNDGTSRLSPALKIGAIGIRDVWAATESAMENARSDETRDHILTWQQELAWREFYQTVMYFFPELAQGPYREPWNRFPWHNDEQKFAAWCEGKTGFPIVDAAMRQLNQTGWMHNRCRMIVASFLTKDLMIDWQWGEKYFMQHLIDGDLSANNGGWQWSASSGMDPKPLRIFNPASQAKKYDPQAEYIRYWLPEIRSLETKDLVTGNISPLDCEACGYPQAIVNHNEQQRLFKQIYKDLKS
ncbi:MAG: deoxyribodipyrimidine photolyase [Phormidium sp. GEM2.Bin31]|nr:MAG: deoxyribodipyrimidine photolyase [Phormidium sp. GEM2.Bin31]